MYMYIYIYIYIYIRIYYIYIYIPYIFSYIVAYAWWFAHVSLYLLLTNKVCMHSIQYLKACFSCYSRIRVHILGKHETCKLKTKSMIEIEYDFLFFIY